MIMEDYYWLHHDEVDDEIYKQDIKTAMSYYILKNVIGQDGLQYTPECLILNWFILYTLIK